MLPQALQSALKKFYNARTAAARRRCADRALVVLAEDLSARCMEEVTSLQDWLGRRQGHRDQLAWMLGLLPLPPRTDLRAQITGILDKGAYRIEKLVFASIPGVFVTASFYLPSKRGKLLPSVLYLNGHWPSLDGAKTGFQDRYLWYPANGFALLVIDPLQFGEIPGVHQGTNRLNMWDWLSLGYTPAGVEVWNAMRALDWLETRPDVDMSRIGVTGISGGGVMTQYLAALDDRVAVAAPSCSTYTIGTQVAGRLVPQQCDCTFYPNVFGLDFPTVLALIAPRPLLIFGGRKDPIFPPVGFRDAFKRAKRIYDLYPPEERCRERIRLVESSQAHTDPPAFLRECRSWMTQWLKSDEALMPERAAEMSPTLEAARTLACLEAPPPEALNYSVHDVWIKVPKPAEPRSIEEWEGRRTELLGTLLERVFSWFPGRDFPFNSRRLISSGGYAGEMASFGEYEFDAEPGVPVRTCAMLPHGQPPTAPLLVWIRRPEDHVSFPDLDELLPLVRTTALVMLTPRFADRVLQPAEFARIERSAALTGRTVAALRVWDVLRTVSWAKNVLGLQPGRIEVYGRGEAGIIGAYAAALDAGISHVILDDPPATHWQGPALLTVLRTTDIPEVLAVLAPRQVTILGRDHRDCTFTQAVYALCGEARSFSVEASVAGAVMKARVRSAKRNGEPLTMVPDAH